MKQSDGAVRIKDVARIAGVSVATVSRTLANPEIVSEATRDAVRAAIAETGYTVNQAARNLRQKRVGGIVALVPNLANPFFSKILSGISSVLREERLNLLVADTMAGAEAREALIAYANRSHADGLIVLDGTLPPEIFRRSGCPPVVLACETIDGLDAASVVADNAGGARLAVDHLAGLGHRHIAHLAGPEQNSLTVDRKRGFEAAMAERGLDPRPEWMLRGDFSLASGRNAARQLLDMDARPTAIFCDNDEMACGLIGELLKNGLSVPGDLSVVGFDNVDFSAHITPALTTVRQHRDALGEAAARVMLDLLDGKPATDRIVLPVELVVRDSTAPLDPGRG